MHIIIIIITVRGYEEVTEHTEKCCLRAVSVTVSGLKSVREFVLVAMFCYLGKDDFLQQLGVKGEVRDRAVDFKLTGIKVVLFSLLLFFLFKKN